jgi:chromosome partitioning protein
VFDTELNEREAFRAMFSFRKPLAGLNPSEVANLDKAVANAEDFAREVISALRGAQQKTEVPA